MVFFSDFQYGFRSSQSTTDLLAVVSDRITGAFNRSGATHLIYSRLLTGCDMLVFLTNLRLMEFQVRYLTLFLLCSVMYGFKWLWMGSLYKNIQLMVQLLKALFLFLHFSHYTLMTFLMMLSVILLSMLIILLSTVSVIEQLICGEN